MHLDAVTVTLIGGMIVTIIGTIVSGIVTVITALRVSNVDAHVSTVSTKAAESAARLDSVAKDTEAIKGHVNSEKTASIGRENAVRAENKLLREIIADKDKTAGLLAQAAASRGRSEVLVTSSSPGVMPPAAEQSLRQIETNTAAIEQNTASTDAKVDDLKGQG